MAADIREEFMRRAFKFRAAVPRFVLKRVPGPVLGLVFILAGPLAEAAGEVGVEAGGAALYQALCARCHGEAGRANTWLGRIFFVSNFSREKWQAKRRDAEILASIDSGPGIMPAFRERLTDADKQALLQVIRGFAVKPAPASAPVSVPAP